MNPVLQTLADAVRINSVNPNYAGGVPESVMADFVCRFFRDRNIEVQRQHVFPDRPNVLAVVPGSNRRRRIILEAHLDTVSSVGMSIDPLNPVIQDGKLYGRGSCDTKGGMVAMMHAMAIVAQSGETPKCDVMFAATIDEEFSYRGVAFLCESLTQQSQSADVAIVAEPTQLQPVFASKGLVRWKISAQGVAAHSAKPHLGVNAIEQMADLIQELKRHQNRLQKRTHPLLGSPTLCISLIRGGEQINLVPADCEIQLDRRIIPGETIDGVLGEYESIVCELNRRDQYQLTMHPPMLTDLPLDTSPETEPSIHFRRVIKRHGLDSVPKGVPFCSDASKFAACGIPSIIFGPGNIDQAHAAIEFVDCEQVLAATTILRDFILEYPSDEAK